MTASLLNLPLPALSAVKLPTQLGAEACAPIYRVFLMSPAVPSSHCVSTVTLLSYEGLWEQEGQRTPLELGAKRKWVRMHNPPLPRSRVLHLAREPRLPGLLNGMHPIVTRDKCEAAGHTAEAQLTMPFPLPAASLTNGEHWG